MRFQEVLRILEGNFYEKVSTYFDTLARAEVLSSSAVQVSISLKTFYVDNFSKKLEYFTLLETVKTMKCVRPPVNSDLYFGVTSQASVNNCNNALVPIGVVVQMFACKLTLSKIQLSLVECVLMHRIVSLDVIQQPPYFGRKDFSRLQLPMLRDHLLLPLGARDVSVENLLECFNFSLPDCTKSMNRDLMKC